MSAPLIIIHALRLHEGLARHPGGNFSHISHLLPSLVPLLQESGFRVCVLVDELGARDLSKTMPREWLEIIGSSRDTVFRSDLLVRAAVKRLGPVIYYRPTGQLPWSDLGCLSIAGVADLNFRWLKIPFIKRIYKELSYRWSFACADRIICISKFTRDDVAEKFGVSTEKLRVVHHGTPYLPDAVDGKLVSGRYWLTFGHQSHKNVELCLNAWPKHIINFPEDKLVVVGQNAHVNEVLKPLARRLGVSNHVVFPGWISNPVLSGLYSKAQGLLFVSRFEGFGLPILEAMSAGCPVIASNVCSIPEVAGDAAILISPDDVAGLVDAMKRLNQPEVRIGLIQRSRIRVTQFTWRAASVKILSVMNELLYLSYSKKK